MSQLSDSKENITKTLIIDPKIKLISLLSKVYNILSKKQLISIHFPKIFLLLNQTITSQKLLFTRNYRVLKLKLISSVI